MAYVMDTKTEMLRLRTFDLDKSYLKVVFNKCLKENSGKRKYFDFYEHILGL